MTVDWDRLPLAGERDCGECEEKHSRQPCKGGCRRIVCKNNPHRRFYCPRCKEVHCGLKRQGRWIVLPHYRNDGTGVIANTPCRGGDVDYEKDRAP